MSALELSTVTAARLSRAESQARTRAQLVSTATEMFLRDGYLATSLEKVAEAAGFTRGAVYSNFRNKDELCMVVLDEIRAQRAAEIVAMFGAPSLADVIGRFDTWAQQVIGDPSWTRLELEFGAHASRDAALTSQMSSRLNGIVDLLGAAITALAAQDDIELPIGARESAIALLSMGVGLGLFRAIDPNLPVSALTDVVRALAMPPA